MAGSAVLHRRDAPPNSGDTPLYSDARSHHRGSVAGRSTHDTTGSLDTPEKINAVMAAMAASMPGWVPPLSTGHARPDGRIRNNVRPPPRREPRCAWLPSAGLGRGTGRRGETATYEVSADALAHAADIVAPVEAATIYQRPNLSRGAACWRICPPPSGGRILAVFIASLENPGSGPYDEALRQQIAEGSKPRSTAESVGDSRRTGTPPCVRYRRVLWAVRQIRPPRPQSRLRTGTSALGAPLMEIASYRGLPVSVGSRTPGFYPDAHGDQQLGAWPLLDVVLVPTLIQQPLVVPLQEVDVVTDDHRGRQFGQA